MTKVITIKALEDGVSVLFANTETGESASPERLDRGEVLILHAPEEHESVHVRGKAKVYTPDHVIDAESALVIGGTPEESPPEDQPN